MNIIYPKYIFENVQSISLELLKKNKIEGIVLDLDNTLIDYDENLSSDVISWVNNIKEQGFKICILSNTNNMNKVKVAADKLGIEYLYSARKPMKKGFVKVIKLFDIIPEKIAIIGDQIFTDIIGGNKMNMLSIYVKPINKREDWYTKWKRPIEAIILKKYNNMKKKIYN